jgi:hypothetical protein
MKPVTQERRDYRFVAHHNANGGLNHLSYTQMKPQTPDEEAYDSRTPPL